MNVKGTTMGTQNDREQEIERTMESYHRDQIIPPDPMLAHRIIGSRRSNVPAVRRWAAELRLSEAAVALSVLINLITMIYVLSVNGQSTVEKDAVQQLRSEYDIELMNLN